MKLLSAVLQIMEDEHVQQMVKYTHQTADNTARDNIDWMVIGISVFSIIIAVVSLYVAYFSLCYTKRTFESQQQTEKNTRRLTIDLQKKLLVDMIRHLYRNMVVTYTMKVKLEKCNYNAYPSEEHLIKLKIPMENIHLDIFYYEDKDYMAMYDLYLKFRNYNEEIELACRHLCAPDVRREVKERDMATLLFKPGFLTSKILTTLKTISDKDDSNVNYYDVARKTIKETHESNVKNNLYTAPEGYTRYNTEDDYIKSLYNEGNTNEFFNMLNNDVIIESGENNQNSPKIYMIEFSKN